MAMLTLHVLLLVSNVMLSSAGFAPTQSEEDALAKCLFAGNTEGRCFKTKNLITRRKRDAPANSLLDSTNEYICALTDYRNIQQKRRTSHEELVSAIPGAGSCAYAYKSVFHTWRKALNNKGRVGRPILPVWQHRNETVLTAGFVQGDIADSYTSGTLVAVDLIISRSHGDDIEVFGKYILKVNMNASDGDSLSVHDTVQGTCSPPGRRYFVAGLNGTGLQAVSDWLSSESKTLSFIVELIPQRQIVKGSALRTEYIERHFDIEPKVSAMVLHFSSSPTQIVPFSHGLYYRREGRSLVSRKKRSPSSSTKAPCRLVQYHVSYRNNPRIVRPTEYNLGECIGSCDADVLATSRFHLNATNHAISMLWDKKRPQASNPEPTVCCAPASLGNLFYVTMDERGLMMSSYAENMVVEYCGCR